MSFFGPVANAPYLPLTRTNCLAIEADLWPVLRQATSTRYITGLLKEGVNL